MNYQEESLKLHENKKGKFEIKSKVSINNKEDLSLAYTPGVASPCLKIKDNKDDVYKYTSKGNMIAIVGNIQTRSWDGQDGKKQFATDVIVEEVYFTGSKSATGGNMGQAAPNTGFTQQQPANSAEAPFDDFDSMGFAAMGGSEDDLPF